jgi:ABC-type nitrate/sulfonate/bicarbonate transport system substrate-binding protein
MVSKMKLLIRIVALLAAALAVATVPARASEIVFGITSSTALSLPHYIAEEKKYYAAEDLTARPSPRACRAGA